MDSNYIEERNEGVKFFKRMGYLILFLTALFSTTAAHGEKLAAGFTIEGIPNNNQVDTNVGYFYLKETPDATDELKIKLKNSSDEDKTLVIKIVDANTNVNGLVDYTGKLTNHTTLKTPLTSIVEAVEQEVNVPKNSEVETMLKVHMPETDFEGVIVSGVVVSEKKEDSQENNLSIENTYSYTIAIVLTNNEETAIKNNVSLELDSIDTKLFDGKKVVQADILNKNPYIFEDATITGTIYEKETHKEVIQNTMEHIEIAPYSIFPFQFDWEKNTMKPGIYSFVGKATSGGKEWTFKRDFEVTDQQAKKLNEETVFKILIPTWLHLGVNILAGTVLVGTAGLILRKKRREKR